eukprot:TRINITY_DN1896_c0_g1_i20.p1 TRINITY_DN1896_c0_g1~~TRINITY_DN1896_c0_g1_i20.p1  ORF type:complete len:219 (+),score=17.48 TRINITY_DN1896_c0_g1_i20:406-1062(+)
MPPVSLLPGVYLTPQRLPCPISQPSLGERKTIGIVPIELQSNVLPTKTPVGESMLPVKESNKKAENRLKPIYRRNIFKSILRNMIKFTSKDRPKIAEQMARLGFSTQEIEHAFFIVSNFKKVDNIRGDRHKYRRLLDNVTNEKSILTHILKESIQSKLIRLENGKHGKIASGNFKEYRKMYTDCYSKVCKVLEEAENGSQIKSTRSEDNELIKLTKIG